MSFRVNLVAACLSLIVVHSSVVQADIGDQKLSVGYVESSDGMLLREGDIFVGRESNNLAPTSRGLGLSSSFSYWPNGIVPYQFHPSLSEFSRNTALQAIEHWNSRSSISLVDRTNSSTAAGSDYVEFVEGPGCASWVGRQGQVQEIWVSDYCTTGSMIHEIGHALGLLHEHTRSDRDQYLSVQWENIQPEKTFNFEVSSDGVSDLGPYDYESIMHYGEYFFSNNGAATLVPTGDTEGAVIGQRLAASSGDLAAINRIYASDVSLSTDISASTVGSDATITVSNNYSSGAHDLVLSFSSNGSVVGYSDSGANWVCNTAESTVECRLDVLPSSATSTLTVSFSQKLSLDELSPSVRSKTFDLDLSNNSAGIDGNMGQANGDDPSIGAATVENEMPDAGASDHLMVLLLVLLATLRHWSSVVGSQKLNLVTTSLKVRNTYASSCFATSPRGTSRPISTLTSRRWSFNNNCKS